MLRNEWKEMTLILFILCVFEGGCDGTTNHAADLTEMDERQDAGKRSRKAMILLPLLQYKNLFHNVHTISSVLIILFRDLMYVYSM